MTDQEIYPFRPGYVTPAPKSTADWIRIPITDFDGVNWRAVRFNVQAYYEERGLNPQIPLADWTLSDIHQHYAQRGPLILKTMGEATTTAPLTMQVGPPLAVYTPQSTSSGVVAQEVKPKSKLMGVTLRSVAEVLHERGGEGVGTIEEILEAFRKRSYEFDRVGNSKKIKNQPLYSIETMGKLIVKCGFADNAETDKEALNAKLEFCRDS